MSDRGALRSAGPGDGFYPLRNEQYDLVMPREFYDSACSQPLLTLIRKQAFKKRVEALGAMTCLMGEVVAELS